MKSLWRTGIESRSPPRVSRFDAPSPPRGRLAAASLALLALAAPRLFAGLSVSPPAIDFGERGHDERPTETLVLRNDGAKPLSVLKIEKSCDCIAIVPSSLSAPIPPRGTATVAVSMTSGRGMGLFEKYLTIRTDDTASPAVRVPVRMRVLEGFSIEPRELHYDGVCGGKPVAQSVLVSPGPRARKRDFSLELVGVFDGSRKREKNPHFELKLAAAEGGKRIDVVLLPTHPEGRIWAELEAKLDGKKLLIPLSGEMFRWIKVVPTYFNFSRVSPDDQGSFRREVVLTSTDERAFRILNMRHEFRMAGPPGLELVLKLPRTELGREAKEHVIAAEVDLPPEALAPAPEGRESAGSGSFSGRVIVTTDHPERPEIVLSFFGFVAPPKAAGGRRP